MNTLTYTVVAKEQTENDVGWFVGQGDYFYLDDYCEWADINIDAISEESICSVCKAVIELTTGQFLKVDHV